jgi:hypothetical protein
MYMKEIFFLKSGESLPAKIEKLFQTHGPFTIEGRRLDCLAKVNVLVDSSISTMQTTGTSTSKAKTGSMLGRAVVGGVLTGGSGAIIGGLSGKREAYTNTISSEVKQTEITAELIFQDENSLYVVIKSIEAFHWLLSFAGQRPLTDDELEVERNKAEELKESQIQKDLEWLRKKSKLNELNSQYVVKNKKELESAFVAFFVAFVIVVVITIIVSAIKPWESLGGYQYNKISQVSMTNNSANKKNNESVNVFKNTEILPSR